MAGCASCLHKNVHPNVCSDCLGGTHFKPRNKTNADRIRSMTDEELAKWLAELEVEASEECSLDEYHNPGIVNDWLDWLREEAVE